MLSKQNNLNIVTSTDHIRNAKNLSGVLLMEIFEHTGLEDY